MNIPSHEVSEEIHAIENVESQPQNPEFRNNPENFHPCRFSEEHQAFS